MKIWYYPGCSLKTGAPELEASALAALEALGIEAMELPEWNCCGAVHSLAQDDLIRQLAPVRMLKQTARLGGGKLLTVCSMCYNTLARSNLIMAQEPDKRAAINLFLDDHDNYQGEVEVVHLLRFLEEEMGWDKIAAAVKKPLTGISAVPYYGCTLNRPKEVALDRPGQEKLLPRLLKALGAQVPPFPEEDLCCGSFQVLADSRQADLTGGAILDRAAQAGAGLLALSCPLCHYNLSNTRARTAQSGPREHPVRIVYFTELLAQALGVGADSGAEPARK